MTTAEASERARQDFVKQQVITARDREDAERLGGVARAQQALNAARARVLAAALQGRWAARRAGGGALVERAAELEEGDALVVEWWPPPEEPAALTPSAPSAAAAAAAVAAAAAANVVTAAAAAAAVSAPAADAGARDAAAEEAERATPRRVELRFLAPGSLAAEMHSAASGAAEEFRIVRGGPLYLVGAPDHFWSMMLHRREEEICGATLASTLPPQRAPRATWDAAWGLRELAAHAHRMAGAPPASRGAAAQQLESRSLAAVHLMRGVAALKQQHQGGGAARADGGAAARALRELHPMRGGAPIPASEAELPEWWLALREFWDGAFARADGGARPPCMFFSTPAGCASGEGKCGARHDEALAEKVRALIAPRSAS
jgi:hypothetical protein